MRGGADHEPRFWLLLQSLMPEGISGVVFYGKRTRLQWLCPQKRLAGKLGVRVAVPRLCLSGGNVCTLEALSCAHPRRIQWAWD